MTINEFVQLLDTHAELPLAFAYEPGSFVRADYHITEIKNVHFDTVDCGGVRNEWKEVHVQLWENATPQPNHRVNTTKAAKIFSAVNKVRETWGEIEMKIEYGNRRFHTGILPIQSVAVMDDQVIVYLGEEQTSCKAIDRANSPEEAALACCGPTEKVATIAEPAFNIAELSVADADAGSCTPGSGCC